MRTSTIVGAGWAARILAIFASLANTRLLLQLAGAENYAALSITLSLAPWVLLLNMGLPNSAQNAISEIRAHSGDIGRIRSTVLTTAIYASVLAIPVAVALAFMTKHLLLASYSTVSVTSIALVILSLGSAAVQAIFNQVLYAMHRGIWPNVMPAMQALTMTVLLFGLTHIESASLTTVSMAILIPSILTTAVLAKVSSTRLFYKVDFAILKSLLEKARPILLFSFISTSALSADYLVMSQILDSASIVQYNLVTRVFAIFLTVHSVLLASTWSSMSDCFYRKDGAGMRRQLRIVLSVGSLTCLLPGALVAINMDKVLPLITGTTTIYPSAWLTFCSFLLLCARIWTDTFAMAHLCCNHVSKLNSYIVYQAVLSISAQLLFGFYLGAAGIVLGVIISFALTAGWILPLNFLHISKEIG